MRNITAVDYWDDFEIIQRMPPDGTPTHLPYLNRICRDAGGGIGLAKGWFVTVGGNPGFGKSVFALNLASAALSAGESVAFVSLEMTMEQVAARFYSIHSKVPIYRLERGSFEPDRWKDAKEYMQGMPPLYVPSRADGQWESVVGFIQDAHDKGCKWFVIDYLQLIQKGDDDRINRAMTELVTDVRTWALNESATVVALSQFNRQTSAEYGLKPRSQGLWGGMILEASSDMVLLLDHSRYRRSDDGKMAKTWVVVDKNRHGPTGDIPVEWDYRTLQMREAMDDETSEWPGSKT